MYGLKFILDNDPYIKDKNKIAHLFNDELDNQKKDTDIKRGTGTAKRSSMRKKSSFIFNDKNITQNFNVSDKDLTAKQKLKAYAHFVIAAKRLQIIISQNKYQLSIDNLKYFSENYEKINNSFKMFVFEKLKASYQQISLKDEKLDIKDNQGYSFLKKMNDQKSKAKYKSIQNKLNVIVAGLNEIAKKENLSSEHLEFLLFITSDYSYIPKKFFSFLELLRLQFDYSMLKNQNKMKKLMILNVYVICKIIIHDILLENKFSKVQMQTVNGKRNLQIIASILYYTIKEKFVGMTKVNKDEKPREVKKRQKLTILKRKRKKKQIKKKKEKKKLLKQKQMTLINMIRSMIKHIKNFFQKKKINLKMK